MNDLKPPSETGYTIVKEITVEEALPLIILQTAPVYIKYYSGDITKCVRLDYQNCLGEPQKYHLIVQDELARYRQHQAWERKSFLKVEKTLEGGVTFENLEEGKFYATYEPYGKTDFYINCEKSPLITVRGGFVYDAVSAWWDYTATGRSEIDIKQLNERVYEEVEWYV